MARLLREAVERTPGIDEPPPGALDALGQLNEIGGETQRFSSHMIRGLSHLPIAF